MSGDTTRPRWYCEVCGIVEYVKQSPGSDNPERAKKRLAKRHKDCSGDIQYRAGFVLGGRPTGQ